MTPERLEELARWRDGMLWITWRNEGAAHRLAPEGRGFDDALLAALAVIPPTDDELRWTDATGSPIDPEHPWWGHRGPSAIEISARRRGIPWPR